MTGRTLRLHSRQAGGATVVRFKPSKNGYFDVDTRRPRHRVARSAVWRVGFGGFRTPWVKRY